LIGLRGAAHVGALFDPMSDNIKTLIGEIEQAIAEIDTVLADQADESPTVVNPFHEKGENQNANLPQLPGDDPSSARRLND
jgi:hypothetical protein